ncbi:DNA repair protein RAD51 homolog 3 isoform X2 [Pieris rapae]|uniref:DNA repair protein RAD51 homolog 3 isoform X2 n=1 Tax=Pieris rapae TaxID=64459 RepID=UPI001E27A350|nr:DNA repair protein RAD51 homolog 3 isoform X2 [Pieris rapae]
MEKLNLTIHPALSSVLLKKLTKNCINTIADFLREDVENISKITKLDVACIFDIRDIIFKNYSAPSVSGTTLHAKYLTQNRYLETGIKRLDTILNGGIPIGFLTEVCGLAGSGKSQFCMQLAINSAKLSHSVIYIDTKGDFSAVRIQKILEAHGLSHKHFGDSNKIGLKFLNMFVNLARCISNEFRTCFICVNIETRWVDQEQVLDLDDEDDTLGEPAYFEIKNRCLGKYWRHIPVQVLSLQKAFQSNTKSCIDINVIAENYNNPCSKLQCQISINCAGVF